jgi:SWI/SNF-related matrix-associated actin-dependent regulator 1 of chromatin subfamily A
MSLYPFQQEGVNFLLGKLPKSGAPHRYLADEMGLGKTVQVCEAINQGGINTALIICPGTVGLKEQWKRELGQWTTFWEDSVQILETRKDKLNASPIIIVNYELLYKSGVASMEIARRRFDLVVCDEVQRLTGIGSKITRRLLSTQGRRGPLISVGTRKFVLSGTPIPNRPIELFPIIRTLAPECIEPYTDYYAYGMRYCNGYENDYGYCFDGASNIDELAERLKPFMLRREIKDVFEQLPEKIITKVHCPVPELHKEGDLDSSNTPMPTLRKLLGEAKLPFVIRFLKDKIESGEPKIVVFAYTRTVVEGIADADELAKYNPVYIYGGISAKDKRFALSYFTKDIRCKLLVIQITSAGTGVDGLQKVTSCMVGAEPEWSHGKFEQVIGRIHRIGQKNIVRIYQILAVNSLDGAIFSSYGQKKLVIDQFWRKQNEVR